MNIDRYLTTVRLIIRAAASPETVADARRAVEHIAHRLGNDDLQLTHVRTNGTPNDVRGA